MAESIKTLVLDVRDTVSANSTKTVDRVPLAAFECLEYIVCYRADAPSKRKVLKCLLRKDDSEIATQIYARQGDIIDIAIDAILVGGDAELQVTNNEAFDVSFIATRVVI